MKLRAIYELHSHEPVASSAEWQEVQAHLKIAIDSIVWPVGSKQFTINPTRQGNGVVPIKRAFTNALVLRGWKTEQDLVPTIRGKVDVALVTPIGTFGVEWETGNVSSSHRALNRLALGILNKTLVGGILVVPSRSLYRFLTDRIGNLQELAPYFPLYKLLPLQECILAVMEIEHDAEDPTVPRISKGTDGWALVQRGKLEGNHPQQQGKAGSSDTQLSLFSE